MLISQALSLELIVDDVVGFSIIEPGSLDSLIIVGVVGRQLSEFAYDVGDCFVIVPVPIDREPK